LNKSLRRIRGVEALREKKGFIAALKALRHPKSFFSASCEGDTLTRNLLRKISTIIRLAS
jgi:CBS domain containing-hemolysin-like protein